jgi:ferric-dicitrate binding protein FerR (iron transport regulator)
MAWATPKVDAARHWAAPQLEQYAHAISENLAPTISGALISAAHKIDVKPKKSKGRRQAVIAGALLAAAAGAAVLVTRRWHSADAYSASGEVSGLGPAADGQPAPERGYEANGGPADQDINGHPRIV